MQVLEGVESREEELMRGNVLDAAEEVKHFSSELICLFKMIVYTM